MKKTVLAFIIGIFLVVPAFAQESEVSPSPTPVAPTPVDYDLPYPGLLPGNALYPLKVLRDRLVEILITKTVKKADFYLLSADKHLNSGILLFKMGKGKIGEETISKGENYLDKALGKAKQAKDQNEAVDEIISKLHLSTLKHEQVIKDLIKNANSQLKISLEGDLRKVENIAKQVEVLKFKK